MFTRLNNKFKLVTQGGHEIKVDGNKTWLCRYGQSANMPFCDSTHAKVGFKSHLDKR